jgi:hypothetical protein
MLLHCRVLTCTYLGLVYGIVFYNTPTDTLTGLRNRMSICFLIPMLASLLPFVSISLFTNDKKVYLADSSAKLYRPWAYYTSKVRSGMAQGMAVCWCFLRECHDRGLLHVGATVKHVQDVITPGTGAGSIA